MAFGCGMQVYKCSGMAALLVTFRQMVPGLKGMKRIFDSLKDILNFNEALIFIYTYIYYFLLTSRWHLQLFQTVLSC